MRTKLRATTHIMEDDSIRLVESLLPTEWVSRRYRPDYGIDLAVEVFGYTRESEKNAATLGEWFFVQVKSTKRLEMRDLDAYARHNVERGKLVEDRKKSVHLQVASLQLETAQLAMVQSLGAAVPVLLFLIDLQGQAAYFVCLNDYIDKLIIPEDPGWDRKKSKVVHVPLLNQLTKGHKDDLEILTFYARRAKLYAAFQKFEYQSHELGYIDRDLREAPDDTFPAVLQEFNASVRHFVTTLLRYDFWERPSIWEPVPGMHRELLGVDRLSVSWSDGTASPELIARTVSDTAPLHARQRYLQSLSPRDLAEYWADYVHSVWSRLATVGRMYEEICREWFLPTYLAAATSYGIGPELSPGSSLGADEAQQSGRVE